MSVHFVRSQVNPITQADEAEREAAKKHLKERRLKAKKKREAKQQEELALVVMERQAMEEELEDLKLAAVAEGDLKGNEIMEKRILKMKKKYDKKIREMRADLVDATEVCTYARTKIILNFLHEALYSTIRESNVWQSQF